MTGPDRFWDRQAETLPRPELEALQMARVRARVERLQRSGNPFYRRLDGIDPDSLRSHETRMTASSSATLPNPKGSAVSLRDDDQSPTAR